MKVRYQLVRLEDAMYEAPDVPQEPTTGDYRPEQVLAALQNWGELTELRARGRLPTLLQCLYLDIQEHTSRLHWSDLATSRGLKDGHDPNSEVAKWGLALRLCRLMNGGAL